ncbi:glycoside hydrolase family 128 protein, partial [Saccharata proteae CBS 121410]
SSSTDTVAKKGLVYNDYSVISEFTSSGTIGWIWNWAQSPGGTVPSGIEYVPSLQNTEGMTNWKTTAKEQIENGSKHLMSFNEPDRTSADGGADLDASTAASYYKEYMNPFSSDDVKLVSPSVCNGDEASVGLNWLEEFMDACDGGCTVDYINIHWYATWTDFSGNMDAAIEYFKSYCDSAYQKFQKPLWITEIGLYSADDSTQQELLDAILPWMAKDNQSYIERYSYF